MRTSLYNFLRRPGVRRLERHFPPSGLVVDLGCGTGLLAHALVDTRPERRVLAVDHDPRRIAHLASTGSGKPIETETASMEDVELPRCRAVALIDVLHYFDPPRQDDLLRRAAEALEPGGVVVLRDPDAGAGWRFTWNRLHERMATATGFTRATVGHYRASDAWAETLSRLGLVPTIEPRTARLYADRVVTGRRA